MILRWFCFASLLRVLAISSEATAAPVIDPISDVSLPAGKSLIIPVTASSANGRPLTFTVTSSTNRITIEVHTNNPFWKMSVVQVAPSNAPGAFQTPFRGGLATVTNIGDMTFMLLRDRAPRTVDAISALDHKWILQQQYDLPSRGARALLHHSRRRPEHQRQRRPGVSLR